MKYAVTYTGGQSPRPAVTQDGKQLTAEQCAARMTALQDALADLHHAALSLPDGMLAELGGLGRFEDLLAGVSDPVAAREVARAYDDAAELEDYRSHRHDFVKAVECAIKFEHLDYGGGDPEEYPPTRLEANVSYWNHILEVLAR